MVEILRIPSQLIRLSQRKRLVGLARSGTRVGSATTLHIIAGSNEVNIWIRSPAHCMVGVIDDRTQYQIFIGSAPGTINLREIADLGTDIGCEPLCSHHIISP